MTEDKMTEAFVEALEEVTKDLDNETLADSVPLSTYQKIHFWNKHYSNEFVAASGQMDHLKTMDAVLMTANAVGHLSEVASFKNEGYVTEEFIEEKTSQAACDLVITAIRLAQLEGFDLAQELPKRIGEITGLDMFDAIKTQYAEMFLEAQNAVQDMKNETDPE